MTVSYATITSAGSGPGPKFTYSFTPQTAGNTVTKTADSYTHTGPFEATTDANGGFSVQIPLGLDQGTVVWKITQTPVTRIGAGRGLSSYVVGNVNITASGTFEALTGSLITPTVVSPDLVTNVGVLATSAAAARDAAQLAAGVWQPTTAYTAGAVAQAPDGSRIKRNTSGTSRASFDSTEQAAWTPVATTTGTVEQAALAAAYAHSDTALVKAPGRVWAFLGDSWTDRSGAAVGMGFVDLVPKIVGTAYVSSAFIEAGVGGNTTAQMLARFDTDVTAAGAQGAFILGGTNDADSGVTLATFASNIQAMVTKAKRAGIPVVIGTAQPARGARATTASRALIASYNAWLRLWAPGAGVKLADTWAAVADPASGDMLAAYDNGDGTHVNTSGHYALAKVIARAIAQTVETQTPLVSAATPDNMISNPLMTGTGSIGPATWFEQGGTGTAPTYSVQPDHSGLLAAGSWETIDFDASASGGTRTVAIAGMAGKWSTGDTLLVCANIQVDDLGGFEAAALAGTADYKLHLVDGSTGLTITGGAAITQAVTGRPGPVAKAITVPSGPTTLVLWFSVTLPTGVHAKFRLGAVGVLNLTRLNLAGMVTA